jgi:hypothetical protein
MLVIGVAIFWLIGRLEGAGERLSSTNTSGLVVVGRCSTRGRRNPLFDPDMEIEHSPRSSCGNEAPQPLQIGDLQRRTRIAPNRRYLPPTPSGSISA